MHARRHDDFERLLVARARTDQPTGDRRRLHGERAEVENHGRSRQEQLVAEKPSMENEGLAAGRKWAFGKPEASSR